MSNINQYVLQNTRILVPPVPSTTVLLSSFSTPFTVTVKDTNGYASTSNPIRISTTQGVFFNTIPNLSSYTLTQPYSFLTLNAISPTQWFAVNSFGMVSSQSVFQVSSIGLSSIQVSSGGLTNPSFSNVRMNNASASTATINGNVFVGGPITVISSATFDSTTTVNSLSTVNIQVIGDISSIGNLAVHHTLVAGGGSLNGVVSIQTNTFFQSISTASNLIVQRQTQLSNAILNGALTTLDGLSFSNISAGTLSVAQQTVFSNAVSINSFSTITNLAIQSNLSISTNLIVTNQLTTSTLTVSSLTTALQTIQFTTLLSTPLSLETNSILSTPAVFTSTANCSSLFTNTRFISQHSTLALYVSSYQTLVSTQTYVSTITNDLIFTNSNCVNITPNGFVNASVELLKNTSTLSYKSDELSILNLCNITVQNTVSVRSQTFGFNDPVSLCNAFIGKTGSLSWVNTNGLFLTANYSGQYLAGVDNNGNLYLTSNFGSNFSIVNTVAETLTDFKMSGSGQYIVTSQGSSNYRYSSNFGASFIFKLINQATTITGATRFIRASDIYNFSYTGQYQLISSRILNPNTNHIVLSSDFGVNWQIVYQYPFTTIYNASDSAISSNGQYMVIALPTQILPVVSYPIYMSSNFGSIGSWSNVGPALNWQGIAMSYSGQYITATASNSPIYISSNYGATWAPTSQSRTYGKVAMTADGKYQVTSALQRSTFYYSVDYGNSWQERYISTSQNILGVTISKNPSFSFLATPGFGQLLFANSAINFQSALDISGDLAVASTVTKVAGSFDIPHPIKPETLLTHSFIEGPRADLVYRGKATFSNSRAVTVNLETQSTENGSKLSPGTFNALARNPQVFLKNNSSPIRVKGVLQPPLLHITASEPTSDTVDWIVVAERNDPSIRAWHSTDKDGYLVLEHSSG